jgi:hypothetical protein
VAYLNRGKYLNLRDTGVGTATGYVSDGLGLTNRVRPNFPYPSRATTRPTQPPVDWVLALFLLGTGSISIGYWLYFYWVLALFLLGTGSISIGSWLYFCWVLALFLLGIGSISIGYWLYFYWVLALFLLGTGSISIGYWLYFPEVERPGRGLVHPLLSSAEVKERVELYL